MLAIFYNKIQFVFPSLRKNYFFTLFVTWAVNNSSLEASMQKKLDK